MNCARFRFYLRSLLLSVVYMWSRGSSDYTSSCDPPVHRSPLTHLTMTSDFHDLSLPLPNTSTVLTLNSTTSNSLTSPHQVVGRASADAARPVLPAETWRDTREQGAQVSRDWWRAGHVTPVLTSGWLQGADPGGGRGQQRGRGAAAAALHQESWDISPVWVQPRGRGRGLVSGGGVRVPRLPRGDGHQQRARLLQVSPHVLILVCTEVRCSTGSSLTPAAGGRSRGFITIASKCSKIL